MDKRKGVGPLPIGDVLNDVAKTAFKKRGFAEAKLISDWPQIVGTHLAQHSTPVKMYFPKGKRQGGTLYIKAFSSLATELQHLEPLIIEKISTHFGYQAVNKIKIIHGEMKQPVRKEENTDKEDNRPSAPTSKRLEKSLSQIEDPELKAALARLGKKVLNSPDIKGEKQ